MRHCWRRHPSTCRSFRTAAVLASSAGEGQELDMKLNIKGQTEQYHAQAEKHALTHLARWNTHTHKHTHTKAEAEKRLTLDRMSPNS